MAWLTGSSAEPIGANGNVPAAWLIGATDPISWERGAMNPGPEVAIAGDRIEATGWTTALRGRVSGASAPVDGVNVCWTAWSVDGTRPSAFVRLLEALLRAVPNVGMVAIPS